MTPAQHARDEWLVLRCQSGDPRAFEELVREMERPLLYFVQKLLGNQDKALDLLQELWLRVFRTIGRLERPGALRTWLYRTARGLAIDRVRKDVADEKREQARAGELAAPSDEPSFDADDAAAVHRALDALEPKHREVLVLGFLEEMSIAEIATVVGCPEGTVKSRIHHAKRALAEALREARYAR